MRLDRHTLLIYILDHDSGLDLDAELLQRMLRLVRQIVRERREYPRRAVQQNDYCFFGTYRAKIVLERLARNLTNGSRELYPRGAGAHNDKRQPCAPLNGIA